MGRILHGHFSAHPRGFAFIRVDEAGHPDIFVAPPDGAGALDGDRVAVEVDPRRGGSKLRGRVVRVLERSARPLVGHLIHPGGQAFISSDNRRHPAAIRIDGAEGLDHGTIVVASVTGEKYPVALLTHVLGDPDDPEMPYLIACARHRIPIDFSAEAEAAAAAFREPAGEIASFRRDLRRQLTMTIDGADARDFDDAVSIEVLAKGGWRLGVHIADVSHYVAPGDPIDEEAFQRGTSVYFPDRAVPMLPEHLSSDVCSLRPQRDRLTITVEVDYDPGGKKQALRCFESIIRSTARLTYDQVDRLIGGEKTPASSEKEKVLPALEHMLALSLKLRRRRLQRGAIDLDLAEPEAVFDSVGEIESFRPRLRNRAHQLIEEFMLQANEGVARILEDVSRTLIYRVHDRPDEARLEAFETVAAHFGCRLGSPTSTRLEGRDFQAFLQQLQGRPERQFLVSLMLRSFERARYSVRNTGHFGLATDSYTHFTSPIRRYPDLVVHRLLKACVRGEPAGTIEARLDAVANHSCLRERAAQEAEREVLRVLMARSMESRRGQVVEVLIVGVSRWGLEVQLPEELIEGRVSIDTFVEEMRFYPDRLRLAGRGRSFQVGDTIAARIARVESDAGRIEFEVAD